MKLLTAEEILGYIYLKEEKSRATLAKLKLEGKSYRTREMTRITAELNLLRDIKDTIIQPQKNSELEEAMIKFGKKEQG